MRVVNIVCSGDMKTPIDLEEIDKAKSEYFIFNPTKYHGGYVILSTGKATIYRTGRYIIVGLKSLDEIDLAFLELKNFLSNFINVSKAEKPKIKNIVAVGKLEIKIELTKFSIVAGLENVEYEPEQFPGLIYRQNKLTALVFSSGKIVLAGAKEVLELEKLFEKIKDLAYTMYA